MTSLGKKTAPHWFLPVPEVSQSGGQPSPYFPKKLPRKLGAPRCPPPGVGGGQWGARRQPVTGMQLSRLPVLHLGATSGCAVLWRNPACKQARKHTHAHTVEFRARWSTLAPSVHGAPRGSRGQAGSGVGRPGWCPSYPAAWEGKWEPGAAQPHYWQEEGEAW